MIGDYMMVNGEQIPKPKAMELIRMLCNDAKEIAGVFHGMNRSEKFRANWPDEVVFAAANWRNFMEAARAMYAQQLGDPHVKEYDKQRMFLAIALYDQVEKCSPEKYPGIQLAPGTQQYEGDKFENRKIVEQWGKQSNTFKELLMSSTRYH
jgi:hypothetical protein